ncbi:MAG: pyrroline-5-carboxylate reductase [Dehalococcoidia bacterium]
MRLSFIGGGVMAEAIIKGVLDQQVAQAEGIVASDPDPARRTWLADNYGVRAIENNLEALNDGEMVVLAVKPQTMPRVLTELQGKPGDDQLVLSIAAGVNLETIRSGLAHDLLIRAMPNTPARIGQGVTMWTATNKVGPGDKEAGASVLRALGEEVYVEDEKYLDMATALSAGGPAYVFTFMETLIDAGVHMGLSREVSQKLVIETVQGSAALAEETGAHPAALRNMVTSPGGTTTEALLVLEEGGFRGLLMRAVLAAYQKTQGLIK